MAVIISVVSGGSVVGAQQLGSAKKGLSRINAVEGARYVLADTLGGGAAAGVIIKRVGNNLVIGQHLDDAEQDALVIEDFYGSGGQLVAQAADGSYQDYIAVTDSGAIDAAQLSDGASSVLTLGAAQPSALAAEFQFSEGGSSLFASALASAAAVAGGVALSTGKSGGGKPSAAPVASALVLEDQVADVATGQPAPAAVEPGIAVVNDIALGAGNNAAVESKPEMEAAGANVEGSSGTPAAIAPFGVDDIPVIDKVMDDYGVIQGGIENGGYTDDGYPTITGKAEPGVKVHIYRNNYLLNYVVADAKGEWSYIPTLPFVTGKHSITIVHEYPDGEVSEQSAPFVITVDKVPPAIPVITGIVDDEGRITGAVTEQAITDDNRPTLTGTAEAHAKVIVYDKGKEIGSATAGADGKWSFTPDTPLTDGLHMLSYSAMDRAGNSSQPTAANEFTVDTRAEKINIYQADDNEGSIQGEMFNGSVTDDRTPTLIGTATAGGIVSIFEGDVLLGKVTADVDGTWQFTPTEALGEGAHTFHATVTLPAKGESERSKPFNLEVDLTAPSVPTIDQLLDDVGIIQGAIGNGKETDDSMPTLTGKAEKGSTVRIFDDGILLGTVVADINGDWIYAPSTSLADGAHSFTISATDAAGNTTTSADKYVVIIDTAAPEAPSIVSVVDDVGLVQGVLQNGASTDDTRPTFSGKAEAGSTVIIRDQGVEIGRVVASTEGDWSFTPGSDLSAGAHGVSVIAQDKAGNLSLPSESFDFEVVLPPPAAPTIVSVHDDFGSLRGEVSSGGTTDDSMPLISGKAVPNTTVILKDNGVEIGRSPVDALGNWSFQPAVALSLGLHNLIATAVDRTGNTGESSSIFGFRVVQPGGGGGMENFNTLESGYVNLEMEGIVLPSGVVLTGDFTVMNRYATRTSDGPRGEDQCQALHLNRYESVRMELPSESKTVSFYHRHGSISPEEYTIGTVAYLDANGVKIGQIVLTSGMNLDQVVFTAPEGKFVSAVEVRTGYAGVVVDVLQWAPRYMTGISISTVEDDGFGGRIVYGTVSGIAHLDADKVIQVSTDGGKTWDDAVFAEGSWLATQMGMPPGDWTAEVRVIERSSGISLGFTDSKLAENLGAGAPKIISIPDAEGMYTWAKAADGSLIEVSLEGTGAKQGDTIHICWGTATYDHVLTKAEIDAGTANVTMPSAPINQQGVSVDFTVTAQIIGKNGTIGAVSQPYEIVGTYALSAVKNDALQTTPVNNAYQGVDFKVTTSGVMSKTAMTASTHAGLTLNDALQANALFTLQKPAREISLRLSGIDSELGVKIQVFDVKGNLIEEQTVYGDATAFHAKVFSYSPTDERVDIGSFKIVANEASVTLDGFSRKDVTHYADTRDAKVIDSNSESFFGSDSDDVVTVRNPIRDSIAGLNAGIHGGGGIDTLRIANIGVGAELNSKYLSSMEIFELVYNANVRKSFAINLSTVLHNGGTDIFYVGDKSRVQMMIIGSDERYDTLNLFDSLTDAVNVSFADADIRVGGDLGGWVKASPVTINGKVYESYQHSTVAAEVLVKSKSIEISVVNRAEFIEVGGRSLRTEPMSEVTVDDDVLDGQSDTRAAAQDGAKVKAGVAMLASALLEPAVDELFDTGSRLLNHGAAAGWDSAASAHPVVSCSSDVFEQQQLLFAAY